MSSPEGLESEESVVPLVRLNVVLQVRVWHHQTHIGQGRGEEGGGTGRKDKELTEIADRDKGFFKEKN